MYDPFWSRVLGHLLTSFALSPFPLFSKCVRIFSTFDPIIDIVSIILLLRRKAVFLYAGLVNKLKCSNGEASKTPMAPNFSKSSHRGFSRWSFNVSKSIMQWGQNCTAASLNYFSWHWSTANEVSDTPRRRTLQILCWWFLITTRSDRSSGACLHTQLFCQQIHLEMEQHVHALKLFSFNIPRTLSCMTSPFSSVNTSQFEKSTQSPGTKLFRYRSHNNEYHVCIRTSSYQPLFLDVFSCMLAFSVNTQMVIVADISIDTIWSIWTCPKRNLWECSNINML